jgi:hypothetical protein
MAEMIDSVPRQLDAYSGKNEEYGHVVSTSSSWVSYLDNGSCGEKSDFDKVI